MDISALRRATNELGAYLSEVTSGDLGRPTTTGSHDLGDLYLHIIAKNRSSAAELSGEGPAPSGTTRETLARAADVHGGGYDVEYRRTALLLERSLAAAPAATVAQHVRETEGWIETVARALGID